MGRGRGQASAAEGVTEAVVFSKTELPVLILGNLEVIIRMRSNCGKEKGRRPR